METLQTTIEKFLSLTKEFKGAQPSFRINYKDGSIEVVESCNGFLKLLFKNDSVCCHFRDGVLNVQYFEK